MFNNKNLSPRQLARFTAIIIALPIALAFWIISTKALLAFSALLIIYFSCYFLFNYILRSYFDDKIKLIYKFISQTKASKREDLFQNELLPQKSLTEVSEDVARWAAQKSSEIEVLRQNEAFRKEFLQNLSHELRTPAFAIQGYIENLIDGGIENKAVAEKFLASAHRNVERLTNLINDLSEITKLEMGSLKINQVYFVIQDLVQEVVQELSLSLKEKSIHFEFKKGTEASIEVFADRPKIKQVVTNLIENAVKYGKLNGLIEAGFFNIDGNSVLVEISDNGMGIPETAMGRIFERFYRTDAARSRKEGGSGLGLAICKHIVEAHGNMMQVRSKVDIGSTFGFTLFTKLNKT